MKWNKKGIMVKFLVVVLLSIIIFAPACIIGSKFFRLSEQAKKNFVNFVDEMKKMEDAVDGERTTLLLILDKETAIVYFEPNKPQARLDAQLAELIFDKPSSCQDDSGCLCLFREIEDDDEENPYQSALCESEINMDLQMDDCGVGVKGNALARYQCYDGFVIERNLVENKLGLYQALGIALTAISPTAAAGGNPGDAYYTAGRRVFIKAEKENGVVSLST
ncbi:MAG: hypothetical protein KKH52_04510 [Nanoarchaeota archaeon]|nr:hypothetical protein [Nanoarchaeota archaeon]MBU1622669.1 hypothetical protein [Nanoarchaeota archaeon]MBU1974628.1 hypothetical protein [Nanoarchaeota archaeon]